MDPTSVRRDSENQCASNPCGCGGQFNRRELLRAAGAGSLTLLTSQWPAMAGPFTREDFEKLVPADKKLNAAWVQALTARGTPTEHRGDELNFIGMPVGGIACGQLYLGGDGRLWYWDIFKSVTTSDYNGRIWAGPKYEHPVQPRSSVEQGFALRVIADGKTTIRTLDRGGFPEVSFRGEYPVGRVTYRDATLPVQVSLEAFSPFIPLNLEDSSLPATVLEFTVRNTSAAPVEVSLAGWLENAVCQGADPGCPLQRRTTIRREPGRVTLLSLAETPPASPAQPAQPDIVFADFERHSQVPGFGSLALTLRDADAPAQGGSGQGPKPLTLAVPDVGDALEPARLFEKLAAPGNQEASRPLSQKLVGVLARTLTLAAGAEAKVTFVLSWWFPYYGKVTGEMTAITEIAKLRRHYARRFDSADAVACYVVEHFPRLAGDTRLWNKTWYDSTLPYWFLDRTFVTVDCLATQTVHAFDNGRWWGWEGVDCCPGTCQHVWHYAQAVARLFPAIERDWRERVDFGLAWHDSGAIDYRGESGRHVAHDGFCGTIVRVYREHQMSPDGGFLRRLWPRVRKSLEFILHEDKDADGILEGQQFNTLDAAWFGPMGWITSLYLAALAAGEALATEMEDADFAARCRRVLDAGRANVVKQLFNGEYFIHRPPDFKHTNTNDGCHIDQVLGQSLAFQVGLPRVIAEQESRSALRALWRYNFTPDIGPYRQGMKPVLPTGRWYAMPGEGGLLMCTWPQGGAEKAAGGGNPTFVGYFIECMTGFEYQVAAHMVWEGLVTEGLAVTRAIHDRYSAAKRNPYNEIECSDHYSRAMMSYGVFLAACGFEYHGPQGRLGFAPRLTPENFRGPFTTAAGWGTFEQQFTAGTQRAQIAVKWGQVRLKELSLVLPTDKPPLSATVTHSGKPLPHRLSVKDGKTLITLADELVIAAGSVLAVEIPRRPG